MGRAKPASYQSDRTGLASTTRRAMGPEVLEVLKDLLPSSLEALPIRSVSAPKTMDMADVIPLG